MLATVIGHGLGAVYEQRAPDWGVQPVMNHLTVQPARPEDVLPGADDEDEIV